MRKWRWAHRHHDIVRLLLAWFDKHMLNYTQHGIIKHTRTCRAPSSAYRCIAQTAKREVTEKRAVCCTMRCTERTTRYASQCILTCKCACVGNSIEMFVFTMHVNWPNRKGDEKLISCTGSRLNCANKSDFMNELKNSFNVLQSCAQHGAFTRVTHKHTHTARDKLKPSCQSCL